MLHLPRNVAQCYVDSIFFDNFVLLYIMANIVVEKFKPGMCDGSNLNG